MSFKETKEKDFNFQEIVLKPTGKYICKGYVLMTLWNEGSEAEISMAPYTIDNLSIEAIASGINDGGFGCKSIDDAFVSIDKQMKGSGRTMLVPLGVVHFINKDGKMELDPPEEDLVKTKLELIENLNKALKDKTFYCFKEEFIISNDNAVIMVTGANIVLVSPNDDEVRKSLIHLPERDLEAIIKQLEIELNEK